VLLLVDEERKEKKREEEKRTAEKRDTVQRYGNIVIDFEALENS